MMFMYFLIKYRFSDIILKNQRIKSQNRSVMYLCLFCIYSDILLKKQTNNNFILKRLFCCNHTCYCVNMVSGTSALRYITSASHYHLRYKVDP